MTEATAPLEPDALEARLVEGTPAGRFRPASVASLPEAARRYLIRSIEAGTPLAGAMRLQMSGSLRLSGRWLPFRATQVLGSHGFVWRGAVGWGPLTVRGWDAFDGTSARVQWSLAGVLPVVRASDADLSRSARGRLASELTLVPTLLLPERGVRWRAEGGGGAVATTEVGGEIVDVHLRIDSDGRLRRVWVDRWGNPGGGEHTLVPFGAEIEAEGTFSGLTIPLACRVGWWIGTDRWSEGELLRFRVTAAEPVGAPPPPARAPGPIGQLDEIVLDCRNPQRLAAFWAEVLGGDPSVSSPAWVVLHPPTGARLAFQRVEEAKTVKNRMHLDVAVSDLARATSRAVALGAERVGVVRHDPDGDFQVLRDPEGNEFCLVAAPTAAA